METGNADKRFNSVAESLAFWLGDGFDSAVVHAGKQVSNPNISD